MGDEAARFDRVRLVTVSALLLLAIIVIGLPMLLGPGMTEMLSVHMALRQDLPLLPIFMGLIFIRVRPSGGGEWQLNDRLALLLSIAVVILVGWAGHYVVFDRVALSRDEQMAVFDQLIFERGAALWPIQEHWRPFADALGRRFMLPIGANEYWVSAYLPTHSAVRALVGVVADPALSSPLLTALAAGCTWGIARRLWPESRSVATVALILLVGSSQVLIMAMTSFSMAMHLALNMLWLLLFLKDRWWAHGLAVLVGFIATGIHQPLFHPLFALPFCALLLVQKRWRVSAFYAVAYGLISALWLAYPLWVTSHGVGTVIPIDCASGNCASGVGFVERLMATLTAVSLSNLWLTAGNLIRFVVWQHMLLMPLAVFGAISCWRSEPLVKALVVSFLLPLVVLALILPWQGHGWGYRYLHQVIGNAVLLACFGFHRLQRSGLSLGRALSLTTLLAAILLAVHGWMAAQMVRPVAAIRDQLSAIPADVVIVDTDEVPFGQDVVVNQPDLTNRPTLLIASLVKPSLMPELCASNSVAFFDAPRLAGLAQVYGQPAPTWPSETAQRIHLAAAEAKCRTIR